MEQDMPGAAAPGELPGELAFPASSLAISLSTMILVSTRYRNEIWIDPSLDNTVTIDSQSCDKSKHDESIVNIEL